jgi:ATP-dependent Clp protease ATP-binding subunit ClpA
MPDLHLRLPALVATLSDEALLAQPLLLPGVSCYAIHPKRLREMLCRRVADVLKQIEPGDLYRYLMAEMPEVRSLNLEVAPLKDDHLRRHGIELPLQYLVWPHGADAIVAFVPALGIEVLANDERQLAELLEPQLRLALSRSKANKSLHELVHLERFRELKVRPLRMRVRLPTLKEAAQRKETEAKQEKSLLKQIASNLVTQPSRPVYERDAEVQRLAELLTRRNPRSVLLVGRSGVGKSALVQQLARRRDQHGLANTPLWSTSGSRIVAGMTGFGMWQERCEKLVREAGKAKAILHLGNLVELIEVGKGGGNLQGVAALLRPHLDRGAFLGIVECTPEQLAVIEREDPQLLETFTQLELQPSTPEQTRVILKSTASERSDGPQLGAEGLATLDRLHRRWATYSAAPGRQLRFLRNLLDDSRSADRLKSGLQQQITPAGVTAAFSRETGLPLFMLDDDMPLDLAQTETWFAERVIGQREAVQQVVELLAAVKTGLARGGKPIASLLFIGPTGVGKTEMAKSLAEFLYQDRGRMIRFDMSEYSHPAAVERLIGGAYAAQGLLTQKVRDQPFTVVLLDEFEKAHPLLFDVLLQVLGEGRLTDGAGRVTDFTNSVVIMTSNLGAESYRRGAVGFAGEASAASFAERHFEREVKAFLRPEMFNRLDRIVPFAPLDRATIVGIARREVSAVLSREGIQFRGVQLQVANEVIDHLAAAGFDPRYGARPLKRAIERHLVAPLAEGINRYHGSLKLRSRTHLEADSLRVEVEPRPVETKAVPDALSELLEEIIDLRRHTQALQQCSIITRLRNEIERLRQDERAREKRLKKRGHAVKYMFTPEQARILAREELLGRIDLLLSDVVSLETEVLGDFYGSQTIATEEFLLRWHDLDEVFRKLLFEVPRIAGSARGVLTLVAFGESLPVCAELMRMYEAVCREHGDQMRWCLLKMYREEFDESKATPGRPFRAPPPPRPVTRLLSRKETEDGPREKVLDVYQASANDLDALPEDCIGIALQISGDRSLALLETEAGQHEFLRIGTRREVCYVETVADRLLAYDPPRDIGRRGSLSNLRVRRIYSQREELIADPLLQKTVPIRGRRTDEAVLKALDLYLTARLWELIEAWS